MVSDMNKIFFIRKDDLKLPDDKIGMIDDGYGSRKADGSLRLDFEHPDGEKRIEYRRHKRLQMDRDAFALIRSIRAEPLKIHGKSMGCIACAVFDAEPAKLGKIDNISMGGLMFHNVVGKAELSQAFVLDILLADCGFYLANIPFETISDVVVPDDIPSDAIEMRRVHLQFQIMNAIQQARLKEFIKRHGTEIRNR